LAPSPSAEGGQAPVGELKFEFSLFDSSFIITKEQLFMVGVYNDL
jgi:hypothetical protein